MIDLKSSNASIPDYNLDSRFKGCGGFYDSSPKRGHMPGERIVNVMLSSSSKVVMNNKAHP